MRGTTGYATLVDPAFFGGHPKEADTFTCAHCNRIVHVKPLKPLDDLGGWCSFCAGLICRSCVGERRCDPFEEKLKRWEAKSSYE
jgi:hypothetical protein